MNPSPAGAVVRVAIVGAGPSGLAIARELQRRGVRARLFERGEVGETWAQIAPTLLLHTRREAAALPGLPLPKSSNPFPSAAEMHAYLQRYAVHHRLEVATGSEVERLQRDAQGWRLDLIGRGRGRWSERAELLVWAAGLWGAPLRPELPNAASFGGTLLHFRDVREVELFAGQRVLVVGGGNSGKELVVALERAGARVALSLRQGLQCVAYPNPLSQWSGELWRRLPTRWLDALLPRLRPDHGALLPRPQRPASQVVPVVGLELIELRRQRRLELRGELIDLSAAGAHFADGRIEAFDAVLLATGFRSDTVLVEPHRGDPQLMIVGDRYPTLETFLQRLRREAPLLAGQVFARSRGRAWGPRLPEA